MDEINSIYDVLSEEDDFLRSLLHFKMGVIHVMRGETAQAVDDFTETLRLSLALNNHLFSLMAYAGLGETCQVRGKLRLAEMAFQQAIGYAKEILGEHTVLLSIPYNSYADLLREQNRFAEAIDYAEIGIAYFQM